MSKLNVIVFVFKIPFARQNIKTKNFLTFTSRIETDIQTVLLDVEY